MKIFVIGGKSGSGKGEVAKIIKEYYIYKLKKCIITEYSKYLKLFAKEMTDWDGESSKKPRDFLQEFGTKIRNDDRYFFTRRMIEDLGIYEKEEDVVVIADARMPEEIEEIKANFDDVISIYVENQFSPSKLTLAQQSHITEIALEDYNDFDYTIANDNLETLKDKVFNILKGLK
jgi:hypothetical protein